jgi:hypothetical protein
LFFELCEVETALFIDGELDDSIAVIFQIPADGEDGGMLDSGSYDFSFVWSGSERAFYSGVVGFGAAACKDDFGWFAAEEAGDLLAGDSDFSGDLSAEGVHTRRVSIKFAEEGLYFFEDFIGDFCGGVVVEINCFHIFNPVLPIGAKPAVKPQAKFFRRRSGDG